MNLNDIKLFLVVLKNIRSKNMNRSMIGYTIEEKLDPVTIEDIILFAEATVDKNAIRYKETGIAPPFFLSKLIIPSLWKILTHKDLKMNFIKLVHSQQDVTWHKEIRVGDQLTAKLSIIDISDIPAGELLTISAKVNMKKSTIIEGTINIIVRGSKSKTEKRNKIEKKLVKGIEYKEILRIKIPTADGQQLKYAKISGDNNFIHTSNLIAKSAGLPRTIMHGVCIMAMSCNTLMNLLIKNDLKRLKSMSVQFGYPAIPGETLELVGYKGKNKKEILFSMFNDSKKKVLKNGMFSFK